MTTEANASSPLRQLMPGLVGINTDLVDSTLWVRMGDERSKHAMLQQVFQDLGDLFDAVALDDEVRVVVLTGAGRRFSTGGSVTGMAERASRQDGIDLSHRSSVLLLSRMYRNLLGVDQPVIAAVNGDAVGAGTTLALHCDIVVAAESARFGDPHVRRGLVASAGAYVWPLLTSLNVAKEYLLTGDLMSAAEAHRLGLVNHVYPDAEILSQAEALASRLAAGAPHAIRWTKRLLNRSAIREWNEMLGDGIAHEMLTFMTADHREGANAFLEKRPARFEGR
jgi:enoyl-CoA hydratase